MRSPPRLLVAAVALCAFGFSPPGRADEPFLKPNEVIAFIGGEDMVVASELGYLELLLTRAMPDHKLRFRCLAWEGDTVFEQRRDLNYPTLEQQLERIGATFVIARFGQMESMNGEGKFREFITAYEKLGRRVGGNGKRRIALQGPHVPLAPGRATMPAWYLQGVAEVISLLPNVHGIGGYGGLESKDGKDLSTRDGYHLNETGHWLHARSCLIGIKIDAPWFFDSEDQRAFQKTLRDQALSPEGIATDPLPRLLELERAHEAELRRELEPLRQLIVQKNRLWFQYSRPQNWAFLAGDRTNQPSSRDHLDPKKRWFPAELEQFVPLIEAKEREIDALAAQLAKP
ncbi:MAG TPA: hypothetical protein VGO90_03275 [Chthoniobacteraceae bacterium]|nr:hypothetical protein [Chthoniobacteraceae bacterium]